MEIRKMTSFWLVECGDIDYEEMVIDINFCEHTLGSVYIENGEEDMEIELYGIPVNGNFLRVPLDDFIEAFESAKRALHGGN